MTDMIEVVIDSIRVSLMSQQRIVILREIREDRYLAIWIGIYFPTLLWLRIPRVINLPLALLLAAGLILTLPGSALGPG